MDLGDLYHLLVSVLGGNHIMFYDRDNFKIYVSFEEIKKEVGCDCIFANVSMDPEKEQFIMSKM